MYNLTVSAVAAIALLLPASAQAADELKFGPAPAWVVATAIPPESNAPVETPLDFLLNDEQIAFEPGRITRYSDVALKIQTDQGLAVGNISVPWNPSRETVTIHRLHIRRGGEVIDVLASGQAFTTLRREANLEAATLDGQLTANIQPEGLQVGDIIHFTMTIERADPVLKNHVEATYADWSAAPIRFARTRLMWPQGMSLKTRHSGALAGAKRSTKDGRNILELSMTNIEPQVLPKNVPIRHILAASRYGEASSFASWAEVAKLLGPVFEDAATVAPSGSLRDEVERIRNASQDPLTRAEQALALVQARIRYVALVMGSGNYVPAKAETTWSRRYGECKAKTALLLALLKELGIAAEPVAVHSTIGDTIAEHLPRLAIFDHVLVRARIGGKDYWLDGTRTGDTSLADLSVPSFGWGLPLVANAELVRISPGPLLVPNTETRLAIDISRGVYAPGTATVEQLVRGDAAVMLEQMLSAATAGQREEFLRSYWKSEYDFLTVKSVSFQHDKSKRETRLIASGDANIDFSDGWFYVPSSSVGAELDLDRPDGPLRDAPFGVEFPAYSRRHVTVEFPKGFFGKYRSKPEPINETLVGVEYRRAAQIAGDRLLVETSERSLVAEIPYVKAQADRPRLAALAEDGIAIRLPGSYRLTPADWQSKLAEKPTSAKGFFERGRALLNSFKFEEAIADFTQALSFDPKNHWALANRGIAKAWLGRAQEAEVDLSAAEAIDANNPIVPRARGLIAEQSGKFAAAVEAYTRSLQLDPKNDFALLRRAAVYQALNLDEKALADTDKALNAGHDVPSVRLLRANIMRSSGDSAGAMKEADLLVEEEAENDFALVAAAKIYASLAAHDRAIQIIDKALAINPRAYVYVNRAQIRPRSEKAKMLADLDAALKLEPENPDALALKAWQLSSDGDHKSALALLDTGAKSDWPGHFGSTRAVILHRAGRAAEAEAEFRSIRAKAKTAADFNELCWTKATAGILLESALEDCREALRREPESGPYLDSMGMVLLRLGQLDEALAAYDKAVEKGTGSASLMGRALVHARRGNIAGAQTDRAEAVKTSPEIEEQFAEYGLKL